MRIRPLALTQAASTRRKRGSCMRIAVLTETDEVETRVAATPETVKKYKALGADVAVQAGAGAPCRHPRRRVRGRRRDHRAERARGRSTAPTSCSRCAARATAELAGLQAGRARHRHHGPLRPARPRSKALADAGVAAFAMELMPRITRAQVMDVLSSQANLAGYRAVIDAAAEYGARHADDDDRGRHRARRRASSSWARASPACRRSPRRAAWAPS